MLNPQGLPVPEDIEIRDRLFRVRSLVGIPATGSAGPTDSYISNTLRILYRSRAFLLLIPLIRPIRPDDDERKLMFRGTELSRLLFPSRYTRETPHHSRAGTGASFVSMFGIAASWFEYSRSLVSLLALPELYEIELARDTRASTARSVRGVLETDTGARFLGVNEHGGVRWFDRTGFGELAAWLSLCTALIHIDPDDGALSTGPSLSIEKAESLRNAVALLYDARNASGYRVDDLCGYLEG